MAPGEEANLAPPCSNLRSFGANVLYWRKYLWHFWDFQALGELFRAPFPPSVRPCSCHRKLIAAVARSVRRRTRDAPPTGSTLRITTIWTWHEQAINIDCARRVICSVACCHSVKLCALFGSGPPIAAVPSSHPFEVWNCGDGLKPTLTSHRRTEKKVLKNYPAKKKKLPKVSLKPISLITVSEFSQFLLNVATKHFPHVLSTKSFYAISL